MTGVYSNHVGCSYVYTDIAGPPSQLVSGGGSMIIDSRPGAFPGKKPKKVIHVLLCMLL